MSSIKLFITLILLSSFRISWAKPPVVVGTKIITESLILGEILVQLMEDKYKIPVEKKFHLGGTKISFSALENGAIDIYPEYTGTGYVTILGKDQVLSSQATYELIAKEFADRYNLLWSPPLGFSNSYAIVVRKQDPKFANVETIGQLVKLKELGILAAPYEFMERKDGYSRFKSHYTFPLEEAQVRPMEPGLMYDALKAHQVDLIMGYSTDGRIGAYDLKVLVDDQQFFPPYDAAFIARKSVLERYPKLVDVFALLKGRISNAAMIEMNDQVDRLQKDPALVAKNFLIKEQLISGNSTNLSAPESFFSFVLRKKEYLFKITSEHMMLSFYSLLIALCLGIPLGIMLTRYERLATYVFPIVNTIQTVPSLALLSFMIPLLGIGPIPAIVALSLYSLLPLVRNTYTGIRDIGHHYIEAARGLGLTNWQILSAVEIPLALPTILAGVRTASVIVIGTATLAAFIGAGGFGDPIHRGMASANSQLILLGAIPVALMAIIFDKLVGQLERQIVSPGLRPTNPQANN